MRSSLLLSLILLLSACALQSANEPVDVSNLPPMTGQERALLISADAAVSGGDVASAERNYMSAVAQSKGHIVAHLSLARLYISQNKNDKAEEILEKALEFQPGNAEANRLSGKIALEDNKPADALERFDAGLKADPTNPDMLSGAGIANDLMHKHAAAQVIYLRALSLRPNDDMSLVKTNLAMSYLLDNKPKKVIDLLKKEVKNPAAPPALRHNLALAYGALGMHKQAIGLLSREITEDERQQSLKRLADHIAADAGTPHPGDKLQKSVPDKKPASVSRYWLQPRVHQHP